MSGYYRVATKFWRDTRGWTDARRVFALYLLTNDHRTTEGLYYLPVGWIATDLQLDEQTVIERLSYMAEQDFAQYDPDAEVVFICKALKYQAPATERQIKGAITHLRDVPPTHLSSAFSSMAAKHSEGLLQAIRKEFGDAFEKVAPSRGGSSHLTSSSSSSNESGAMSESRGREQVRPEGPAATNQALRVTAGEAA